MTWKETLPRHYERPYDGTEQMVRGFTGHFKPLNRTHWIVNLTVRSSLKLSGEEATSILRPAWARIRHAYPFVAAAARDELGCFEYKSPDSAELEKWLDASVVVHLEDSTTEDLLSSPGLVENSCLHFFPSSGIFVFRFNHYFIDGTGIQHLVHRFFQHLCNEDAKQLPKFGNESIRLAPSPSEAAGWPTEQPEAVQEQLRQAALAQIGKLLTSTGFPVKGPGLPGATRHVSVAVDGSTLAGILQSCRSAGFKLTAAIHAAATAALAELRSHGDSPTAPATYNSAGNFDYRRYMRAPYNDPGLWAGGFYEMSVAFEVPVDAPFAEQAKRFQRLYSTLLADRDREAAVATYDGFCIEFAKILAAPSPADTIPPTQPMLTNWGVLSDVLQQRYEGKTGLGFDLEDVQPTMEICVPGPMLIVWTWKGTLSMTMCFNEAYYEVESMKTYMARVKAILLEETEKL